MFNFSMLYSKNRSAVFIAILFHFSGAIGILFTPYRDWFVNNTPLILLIMFFLLTKSQRSISKKYIAFLLVAFLTGISTEIIGVNTGLLFGQYQYSNVFGLKLYGVPWLIGINWFIIVFSASSFFNQILAAIQQRFNINCTASMIAICQVIGGAFIATCFDFILEPVAIKLNFWTWEGAEIPMFNYFCWFIISATLLTVKKYLQLPERNSFATNLFLIQASFFLVLNLLLPYFK